MHSGSFGQLREAPQQMSDPAQFVFSFRSPYAWMAARWVLPQLPRDFEIEWRPFFPLPSFTNFPPLLEAKTKYLVRDVLRLAEHYGAKVRFPSVGDPNWAIPHGAFLEARARGLGPEFALAIMDARWTRGENVAEPSALAAAADVAGLDPDPIVAAGLDETRQREVTDAVQRDFDQREIFGVPTLIMPRGTRYWGHDRIDWAIRQGLVPGPAA
jgi:2-hydroxychromene-2-carboxylate isomerase